MDICICRPDHPCTIIFKALMKDPKSLILLLLASFSLVLSIVLGYYFINETKKTKPELIAVTPASPQKDSLQVKYVNTINDLGSLPAPKINGLSDADARIKMEELYRLKEEISAILKNTNSSKADLELARLKIDELQKRVEELRNRNDDIEQENKRLSALLKQITGDLNPTVTPQNKPVNTDSKIPADNKLIENNGSSVFTAYNLSLSAIEANTGEETIVAGQTEKLVGSFTVKNNLSQLSNAEMMIVVLQPNGKVLQSSPWESGTFMTNEGKKIYSCKVKFDYRKGEAKQCNFSIAADSYSGGSYTLQIYYNGILLGRMIKILS